MGRSARSRRSFSRGVGGSLLRCSRNSVRGASRSRSTLSRLRGAQACRAARDASSSKANGQPARYRTASTRRHGHARARARHIVARLTRGARMGVTMFAHDEQHELEPSEGERANRADHDAEGARGDSTETGARGPNVKTGTLRRRSRVVRSATGDRHSETGRWVVGASEDEESRTAARTSRQGQGAFFLVRAPWRGS